MATAGMPLEEVVGWGQSRCRQQCVDCLAGLFGELELDRSSCLPLADRGLVDGVAVWCNILNPEADDVAATLSISR